MRCWSVDATRRFDVHGPLQLNTCQFLGSKSSRYIDELSSQIMILLSYEISVGLVEKYSDHTENLFRVFIENIHFGVTWTKTFVYI